MNQSYYFFQVLHLEERLDEVVSSLWQTANEIEDDDEEEIQRKKVHGIGSSLPHGGIARARMFYLGGMHYFHEALRLQEAGGAQNHLLAKNLLAEAEQCASEAAARFFTTEDAEDEVEELKDDVFMHM